MSNTAHIINIQRMSVHDGDGLRTTVFMKGCPVRCIWCHNPESQKFENEILCDEARCVQCGSCVRVCPKGCHEIVGQKHVFHRENCDLCGKCVENCGANVLSFAAKQYTADQVLEVVCRDKLFYGNDGGLTVSGGEPMSQIDFLEELCKKAKQAGLNVDVETCGYCPTEYFDRVMPYVDEFLYDVKAVPEKHKEFTGVESDLILKNLTYICQKGATVVLRCPIIPGCNDNEEHYAFIQSLSRSLPNIKRVDLEPYHAFGLSKYAQLGREALYANEQDLDKESMEKAFAPYRK